MEAIILTKSVMNKEKTGQQGSCVTAYDIYANCFVRFVSDEYGSPIPYNISDRFSLLDIVSVNVLCRCPISPQMENLLVDPISFSKIGKYQPGIEEIYRMVPPPPFPRYMDDDNYKLTSVNGYNHSLELIRVSKLHVFLDSHQKVKAHFQLNHQWRKFYSVTDPDAIQRAYSENGTIGEAYIMVSIPTEPISNGYYKFIAAIYPVHAPPF